MVNFDWRTVLDWAGCGWRYILRLGDATSQWLNVAILLGDNPNESMSGRSWRLRTQPGWKQLRTFLDIVFYPIGEDHCRNAYDADLKRARRLIREAQLKQFDMA